MFQLCQVSITSIKSLYFVWLNKFFLKDSNNLKIIKLFKHFERLKELITCSNCVKSPSHQSKHFILCGSKNLKKN